MLIDFKGKKREVILTMKSSKVSSVFKSWLCYKFRNGTNMLLYSNNAHIQCGCKMNSSSNCSYTVIQQDPQEGA